MSMMSIWRQITTRSFPSSSTLPSPSLFPTSSRFFSSFPYVVKVGIPEFLRGIGNGVEAHVLKLETEFGGDIHKLLAVRTHKLKKLEIPCKHRKLILSHAQKYRVGLWRPLVDVVKKFESA